MSEWINEKQLRLLAISWLKSFFFGDKVESLANWGFGKGIAMDVQADNTPPGMLFDVGSAREFYECESQQQIALRILRARALTKYAFEKDTGSRLAPSIDMLKNGWGFDIIGKGTSSDPYRLLNRNQSPTRVLVREKSPIKDAYYETEHWAAARQKRYEFDNHRCVICSSTSFDSLICHHIKYNLFRETMDELMTVCQSHHKMIHDNCFLKFPTGIEVWVAERILGVVTYSFPEWLLP